MKQEQMPYCSLTSSLAITDVRSVSYHLIWISSSGEPHRATTLEGTIMTQVIGAMRQKIEGLIREPKQRDRRPLKRNRHKRRNQSPKR